MAKMFINILSEFGCLHLLHCLTADNASNNKKMAKILETISQDQKQFNFNAKKNLIPCFAHVLNLVSKAIIDNGVTKRMSKKDVQNVLENENGDDQNSSDDGHKDEECNDEECNDEESNHVAGDDKEANINEAEYFTETPIEKLRLGCKLIKRRSKLQEAFKNIRNRLQLPKLNLKKDIPTRWNTTKDMVERFLILKDAYNHVVAGSEELRDACYINQEELQYLEKLNDYLDIFYATTLFLCSQR